MPEGLSPLFDCLCHAIEENGRAFYWRRLTGTINFPPPRFLGTPSPLHGERVVSWVKFFTHALLDGDGALSFKLDPLLNAAGQSENHEAWINHAVGGGYDAPAS